MTHRMTYEEAEQLLADSLRFGIDPSLEPITRMCEAMGDPQARYRSIQVTGTNGKTSTTRMIAALLHAQGLHVGLYVSPHLVKYPERIEIDGKVVDEGRFAEAIAAAADAANDAGLVATEFELLTAAALWLFAREGVEWAVLECGLGGRWDATTVVDPEVAVITGVALEHTEILGDTIERIAEEKAAIIKSGGHAVLAHDLAAGEVFERRARFVGADCSCASPSMVSGFEGSLAHLPGYQRQNAATAIAAATVALGHPLAPETIDGAFRALSIPGRFEVLRKEPLVVIDAAHNPQSAQALASEVERRFVTASLSADRARQLRAQGVPFAPTLLIGVLADKDARNVVRALCPLFARIVATASSSPRSIPAGDLARIIEEETGVAPEVASTIEDAFESLRDEAVLATGSITVAGEVKRIWC